REIFDHVELIPGDSLTFLASPSPFSLDTMTLIGRYKKRKLANSYMTPGYFKYRLDPSRRRHVVDALSGVGEAVINTDFNPISYYYYGKMWMDKFSSPVYFLASLFMALALFLLLSLLLRTGFAKTISSDLPKYTPRMFIFAMGFIGILIELVVIISYQVTVGYVYWHMGMLFASFMMGLALGGALGKNKIGLPEKKYLKYLIFITFFITCLALCIPFIISRVNARYPDLLFLIYPCGLVCVGFIVGLSLPLGGYMSVMRKSQTEGKVYGADLWGASLGSLMCGSVLIPMLGLWGALYAGAGVGLITAAAIIFNYGKIQR
ncbi:MAG: hypothetical protein ABIH01_02860, partial [Candidatus Omnitrophota bacterium]